VEWIDLREVRGKKGPVETSYSAELAFVKAGEGRMVIPSSLGRSVGSFLLKTGRKKKELHEL